MNFRRGSTRLALAMLLPGFILSPRLALPQQDAETLYNNFCAACHDSPDSQADTHTPSRSDMALFTPNSVYAALDDGLMRLQAVALQDADKRALAAWVTGKEVTEVQLDITVHLCSDNPPPGAGARLHWNGWGPNVRNSRFAAEGGISAGDLPKLELAWAYGLPGEGQPRAQPAIADGRLYVGSRSGALYAINADSGCTYWTFLPRAGIRSAISLAPFDFEDGSRGLAAYFVDVLATVYAVNAHSGELLWQRKIEDHPSVRGTGALTVHDGRVYVPMSGVTEENTASNPEYSCCTFRGSLSSLDARTGAVIWKYYTVEEPLPRGTSRTGVPLFGPAGVGIWSAPTVDAKRGLLYAATGNAYAEPAPMTSDAVIALDIHTGELVWVNQLTPGDAWIGGCPQNNDNPNCPTDIGPDLDFSASPVLAATSAGRELIVVPQKSGMVYALDPDADGTLVWEYRAGPGSPVGGIWGAAVAGDITYVARGGYFSAETGGIHGIDTSTGERRWFTPPADLLCSPGQGCGATQSAAVTAIPGAVFSGSQDGGLRAYAELNGEILWTFDANREFTTVNGVSANGGSFDGAGPAIANGMLYVLSGNAGFVGRPGNVLLAFKVRP